ncbi:MAG: helix-turn-helix domain-containing protein [Oscillospiraceae bacterium]|nr:helix-turn-helix domain-containing protein [Oscillospiraceae bacterium]
MKKRNTADYTIVLKNLKKIRKGNKLTQAQVASHLGVDRSTYAYYEGGRSLPGIDAVDKLIKLYGISYADLFAPLDTDPPLSHIEELDPTKQERALIFRFRTMSADQRRALIDSMDK